MGPISNALREPHSQEMRSITEISESSGRMTPITEEPTSAEHTRCSSPSQPAGTRLTPRRIYIQIPVEGQSSNHQIPVHYSNDTMAESIAQLEELEELERELWEARHPGTEIDSDRLLKEVEDEVEATSNLASRAFRIFLVKVRNLRETAREYSALVRETSPVDSLADESPSKQNFYDSIGTATDEYLHLALQGRAQDARLTPESSTDKSKDCDDDLMLQQLISSSDFGTTIDGIDDLPAVYLHDHLHNSQPS